MENAAVVAETVYNLWDLNTKDKDDILSALKECYEKGYKDGNNNCVSEMKSQLDNVLIAKEWKDN